MSKIMLVEDDTSLREIYQARLEAEGYTIVSAKDGEEALAIIGQEKPDLILLDIMMPKISGFDALDIIRSTPVVKGVKVIMMTALSQAEDKARAEKLGADKYLVKSQVTLEDIVKAVKEVLDSDNTGGVAMPTDNTNSTMPQGGDTTTQSSTPASEPGMVPPISDSTWQPSTDTTSTPTESPTSPEPAPTPASNEPMNTPSAPTPIVVSMDSSSNDSTSAAPTASEEGQAVSQQMNNFENTSPSTDSTSPDQVTTPPSPVDTTSDVSSDANPMDSSTSSDDGSSSDSMGGGKKVIQPISGDSSDVKPDINDLLAKESEKENTGGTDMAASDQPTSATDTNSDNSQMPDNSNPA